HDALADSRFRFRAAGAAEEIPGADLAQPGAQLDEVVLVLLDLGEGELPDPRLAPQLLEEPVAALQELRVLRLAQRVEALAHVRLAGGAHAAHVEEEGLTLGLLDEGLDP